MESSKAWHPAKMRHPKNVKRRARNLAQILWTPRHPFRPVPPPQIVFWRRRRRFTSRGRSNRRRDEMCERRVVAVRKFRFLRLQRWLRVLRSRTLAVLVLHTYMAGFHWPYKWDTLHLWLFWTYFRLLWVTIMLPKWFVYVANCLPLPPLRKHSNSGTQRKVANCKSRSYGAAAAAAAGILRATIRGRRRCRDSHEADRRQGLQSTFEDLTGTNTYDVRKFFGFFDPLPPLSLSQIGWFRLIPFICFLGTPSPHPVRTSYMELYGSPLTGTKTYFGHNSSRKWY